jgi:uncharacterized protein YbaR (Trm112 family)
MRNKLNSSQTRETPQIMSQNLVWEVIKIIYTIKTKIKLLMEDHLRQET